MRYSAVPKTDIEDEDSDDTSCGISHFKPLLLQKWNNPTTYLIIHCLVGVFMSASFSYLAGCLTTLEKRYDYDTTISGLILLSEDLAPILSSVFVGYFGGKSHRPRVVASGMVMIMVSNLLLSAPYFIYGAEYYVEHSSISVSLTNVSSQNSSNSNICLSPLKEDCNYSIVTLAVMLLFIGQFIKGFGTQTHNTVGLSYLDDNLKKQQSAMYLGTLFALRLLGPTLGFLLSSLCLQYYEDPFHDPGFDQKDPRWIGAWWLGFIILGVSIFIFSLPMILFPRRFPSKKIPSSLSKKKNEPPESPLQQLKGMGKALKRLGKNPILICHYLGGVFRLNGLVGYYVLLPKYMEMQFRQSASKASLYSGPASIIGMQIGILFGGYLIRRFKPRPRVMTGGIMFAESFSVIALILCMFITCPVYHLSGTTMGTGTSLNLQNECNRNCSCTTKVFTPICGPDGISTYFSPCFAGCTGRNMTDDGKEIFTDCRCVHNEAGEFSLGSVIKNYCDSDCQWMITFIVVLSIGKLLSSTARVGNTLVTLRCVDPEDKSIALGALNGVFSLLAFIPYPLIYGALTDASCLVWEESCGKTGNCWIYDADKFRFLLHGVSAAFVFLGCLTDILVWILSPRLRNLYDDDDDLKDTADNEINLDKAKDQEILSNGAIFGVTKPGTENGDLNSTNNVVKERITSM